MESELNCLKLTANELFSKDRGLFSNIGLGEEWLIDHSLVSVREKIGEGEFGEVFTGTLHGRTDQDVAIKTLKAGQKHTPVTKVSHFGNLKLVCFA